MFRLALISTLVGLSAFATEPPPQRATVAMFLSHSINLEPVQAESLGAVCALRYAEISGARVVGPDEARAAVGPNGSVVDAAASLGASESIDLTVVNLGANNRPGRLLINAVRRASDGSEVYRVDATADSLDDTPAACERLALSLTRRLPLGDTITRHNVTRAEARASGRPNRVGSAHSFGVRTSFGLPVTTTTTTVNPVASITFDARLEFERWFIELGVGALIPAVVSSASSSYGGITSELGGSYYLSDADTTAYLGLGVQPRIVFSGAVLNLAPYAQLGVVFSRHASTRLYGELRVSQNVLPVVFVSPTPFNTSGVGLYPTELVAELGVGF